ncbi:hypothetical protein CrLKS3_g28 [Cylindrospermopsis phage Cr-LKS3]|nr:hypothetical protein CrLKS3_g28 [Cylindrospermopsis phage Cr-LKS3]
MSDYHYSITCDLCGVHLCWWSYGGPFHGSCRCDDCRDKDEGDSNDE